MKTVQLVHCSMVYPWVGDGGQQFEVTDAQAAEMVANGFMEYAPPPEHNMWADPLPPLGYDRETGEIVTEIPAPEPAVGQPRDETSEDPEDDGKLKRPWSNRPKAEWVAYAVQEGHDPDEAAALPKADLMSLYGERL